MTEKIRIDVVTLDSVQCAACTYMMESIAALPENVQQMIDYQEWSIKRKEGIAKFIQFKCKVLPTIVIEGEPVFQSMIPLYEELIDALARRASSEAMRRSLLAVRDQEFDFDRLKENLEKAGAGKNTRR
jgi:hypothetical protein